MQTLIPLFTAALVIPLVLASALLAQWRRAQAGTRACALSERGLAAARDAEQIALRRLRLAAHELRGAGITLQGHSEALAHLYYDGAAGICTISADLLDLADDLQDQGLHSGAPRALRDERIVLAAAVDEAVAGIAANLAPGKRSWQVDVSVQGVVLTADRRALRLVLSRVLADAVRTTRHGDWIDISVARHPLGLLVMVADEGIGTATPDATRDPIAPAEPADSRGIGLRLTLASVLMEAMGGRLDVVARSSVGTRVSLMFPQARVLPPTWSPIGTPAQPPVSLPSHSYAAPEPAWSDADR